jgi:cytochrome c oxidase subunit 3
MILRTPDKAWSGGVSPFATHSKKLGMWLFIVGDSLTFATMLMVCAYLRLSAPTWPAPFAVYPAIVNACVMTFFLLTSSLTMVKAVEAMEQGARPAAVKWLLATMLGGAAFVGLHLDEWLHLLRQPPWSQRGFSTAFFTVTGLHMAHVTAGIVYLGVIAAGVARGKFAHEDVETSGLYWHFVDLVWMFLFPVVYLMSVQGGAR